MSHIKVLVIVTTYNESEIIEDVINDIKKNFQLNLNQQHQL